MLLTELLFFDTDCLSAFLWVGNECLLPILYPGKIVIPMPVYSELNRPSIPNLKARIDSLKHITTGDILIDAYKRKYISENQGNVIWNNMLAKRRRLGAASFTDYLKQKQVII